MRSHDNSACFTYALPLRTAKGLPSVQILVTTEHGPDIIYADLDFAEVEERRRNMPLSTQKRSDLYELVDKAA